MSTEIFSYKSLRIKTIGHATRTPQLRSKLATGLTNNDNTDVIINNHHYNDLI